MLINKKKYVGNVKDLKVYQKALQFCNNIYRIVKNFPEYEQYNLSAMLRKSSTSIVANLSEGNTNFYYKKEYNHLNIALSRIGECRSALEICKVEGYITYKVYADFDVQAEIILKMIIGMMNRIERLLSNEQDNLDINRAVNKSSEIFIDSLELIKKATTFNDFILGIVEQYPKTEKDNQKDQIIRASKSIIENLKRTKTTSSSQSFLDLNTALGSVSECKSFIDMAIISNFITTEQYHELDSIGDEILAWIIELMNQFQQNGEENKDVS